MSENAAVDAPELPAPVEHALAAFTEALRETFGERLVSVTLFGSAAEGRLRANSDVNVAVVTATFTRDDAVRLRAPLALAHAAVDLRAMFLRADEVPAAAEAFAAKFADIRRRRRVLAGTDVFAGVAIPRAAEIHRVKQVLLNLVLRTRSAYALRGLRDEQASLLLADLAGPLRACAAALRELEGTPAADGRTALERLAGARFRAPVALLSRARQEGHLPPEDAGPALFELLELAQDLRARAEALGGRA
jgi:predicted nucleotidyltransferase